MPDEPTYLTQQGKLDLEREYDRLVNEERLHLAQLLKEAVSQGDLKENADYHDAKEKQALLEGRIMHLENILRDVIIIDAKGPKGIVGIGSRVTIRESDFEEDETYFIVGSAESDPSKGKISQKSPIGSALLGHKKGDKVKVTTPSGSIEFQIMKIE